MRLLPCRGMAPACASGFYAKTAALGNRSPELVDANDRPGRVCRRPCARAARPPPVGVRSTKIGHPFRLAARRSRSRYRRRKDVKVERVEWIVVPEPSVAAAALADGEVDW